MSATMRTDNFEKLPRKKPIKSKYKGWKIVRKEQRKLKQHTQWS